MTQIGMTRLDLCHEMPIQYLFLSSTRHLKLNVSKTECQLFLSLIPRTFKKQPQKQEFYFMQEITNKIAEK